MILRLLQHYWTDTDTPALRQAQLEDWLEDTIEFGPAILAEACREWRRTQTRRPVPSEIRRLCIERQTAQAERANGPAAIDMEEYARSVGFASNAERMEAIRASKRDTAADGERLRRIEDELKFRRVEVAERTAKSLGVTAREVAEEAMRRSQAELGIKVDAESEAPAQAAE